MVEQANFSELRSKISNWDLDAEEMLLNKIKIFTSSYTSEFATFTQNMQNLSNNLINTEVDHYKEISNLKELSMNRFIEESLEENASSVSEGSDGGLEKGSKKETFLDNNEKMKTALDMSLKFIEDINSKKGKNKEQIEDDTVSITSKNISFDNLKKYGNLPFIIGTENFMKDKNIGLSNFKDEEEEKKEEEKEEEKKKIKENYGDLEIVEKRNGKKLKRRSTRKSRKKSKKRKKIKKHKIFQIIMIKLKILMKKLKKK